MKVFHFSKTYFRKFIFDEDRIRIVIKETPSLEIHEEDYSLRIDTRHWKDKPIHRDYAIEHHLSQKKHDHPHLQFKFHTEEIGSFWIRLDFKDAEEYRKAILGFIYKIKNILESLENIKEGITSEILVLELVDKLKEEGDFLDRKITESFQKYGIELKDTEKTREKINKLKNSQVLLDFLGKKNIEKINID